MSVFNPPKVSTTFITYIGLVDQASTLKLKSNPTIASGDFKVSIDGGALANLGTLPTVTPASSVMVKCTLSTSEMAGGNATLVSIDAAGAEWCDRLDNFQTVTRQLEDLAFPATSGRSLLVDATGNVDARLADAVAHGGTLGSSTATFAMSRMNLISQTVNQSAFACTGNGTGSAFELRGGATGHGIVSIGGGTSGDGIRCTTTDGHGFNLAPAGNSKHGIFATGGNSGTSDGIKAAAGNAGVDIRGAITGNITGNLSGSVGSVTGAVGSVAGAVGSVTGNVGGNVVGTVASVVGSVGSVVGLTAANLDVAVSTRLSSAGYTAPDNASITAIKAKTDSLTFTVATRLDVNIKAVNDVTLTGTGVLGSEWKP